MDRGAPVRQDLRGESRSRWSYRRGVTSRSAIGSTISTSRKGSFRPREILRSISISTFPANFRRSSKAFLTISACNPATTVSCFVRRAAPLRASSNKSSGMSIVVLMLQAYNMADLDASDAVSDPRQAALQPWRWLLVSRIGWLSRLILVPLLNVVLLYYIAEAEWPNVT